MIYKPMRYHVTIRDAVDAAIIRTIHVYSACHLFATPDVDIRRFIAHATATL